MARLQAPVAAASPLVIEQGRLSDISPFIHVDPPDGLGTRGSRHVCAIVEPVVPSPGATDVGAELLVLLRRELAARNGQSGTAALLGAVEAANAWLYDLNRERAPERRFQFGLTCLVARDDELFMAQVPPTQALIAQEGVPYAFPGLETWRWHRRQEADEGPRPLGLFGTLEPELYHTRVERGDLIVLASTALGRVMERAPQDPLIAGDAGVALDHLLELAALYGVDGARGAAVAVGPTGESVARPPSGLLHRVGGLLTDLLPEDTVEQWTHRRRRGTSAQEVDLHAETVHTLDYPDEVAWDDPGAYEAPGQVEGTPDFGSSDSISWGQPSRTTHGAALDDDDAVWQPATSGVASAEQQPATRGSGEGSGKLTGLLTGAVLALSAAVVGVWQLTVHRDRPIDRPRDDGTLGLPRLHRYHDSPQMPDFTGIRRRMPRLPISRLTGMVAFLLVILLAVVLVYSINSSRMRARETRMEDTFQSAVAARTQAGQMTNAAAALAYLDAARARLTQASALGLDQTRQAQELAAIGVAHDAALDVERLANIQVLGGVPAAPTGVTPRLFFGNGQVYLLTDALYRLDANGSALIRLLGAGDAVGGGTVGTLLGAAWGDGAPVAFDEVAAYLFDPTTATWSRQALGNFGAAYSGIVASNGFGGNLYLLSPQSGQILKFAAGAYQAQPEDWTGGLAEADLRTAVDMQIDGRIYVLLADGRVLDFFMSALDDTVTIAPTPAITHAVALSAQPDRPYVYVADDQSRILRVTRDGTVVQQFMAAEGAPAIDHIRDIVVDDALGMGYVLTDNALLSVRLPGPPR